MSEPNETRDLSHSTPQDPNPNPTGSPGSESKSALPSAAVGFAARLEALADRMDQGTGDQTPYQSTEPPISDRPVPDPTPGYELLSELGRGGMGVVYRARDKRLNREVALKMILRADTSRVVVARFWAEAEVMAAVKHPHVVQVYELGEHAGRPFMVMELVSGGSLADRLKASISLPPRAAAELVEKIARGVAAAHDLGIVHRDLKPGNVLLAADETPKVTDFGLAKRQTNDLTATQAVMGTPAYMAPEQAAGRAKFVGPQADVWALGVILYECLAGTRPFHGDTAATLLSNIQSAEPPALRTVVRSTPRDLETIAAKCLAKEAEHRYSTAGELADDLGRFIRGETIAARPVGRAERLVRWVRRKPTAAAAYGFSTLAVLLAAVVFVIFGFWREAEGQKTIAEGAKREADTARAREAELRQLADTAKDEAIGQRGLANVAKNEAIKSRDIAETARQGEKAAKKEVERQKEILARVNYGRTIQVAYQAWKDNKIAEARALLASTRKDLRGWEYDYIHRLCHADLVTLGGHTNNYVRSAVWDSSRSLVLTTGGIDARLWDSATGNLIHEFNSGKGSTLQATSFSPEGYRVVTADSTSRVRVWEATTKRLIQEFQENGNVGLLRAAFNHDGTKLITALDQLAWVRDATTGKLLHELKGHTSAIRAVAFSPEGSKVVTTSGDQAVRLWDTASGKLLHELKGSELFFGSSPFSPDGTKFVTGPTTNLGSVMIWDTATGKPIQELKTNSQPSVYVSFSADGSKLVVVDTAGVGATLWDVVTGQQLRTLAVNGESVRFPAFSPDGTRIVMHGDRGSAWVWTLKSSSPPRQLKGHTHSLTGGPAVFSPDGTRMVTVSEDGTARIWDARQDTFLEEFPLEANQSRQSYASSSPDGTKIVTIGHITARVWDVGTNQLLREFKHPTGVTSASFSPDGTQLVTTCADNKGWLWDSITGEFVRELKGDTGHVYAASFSPDGTKIVAGCGDKISRVWEVATGKLLHELRGHPDVINSASFSPDGSKIVTGDNNGTIWLWHTTVGNPIRKLTGTLRGASLGARFSPAGKQVAAPIWDTVWVWDVATGQVLHKLEGHKGLVFLVSFSPDGSKILTAGNDETTRLWDAASGKPLHEFKWYASRVSFALFSSDGRRIITADSKTVRICDTESGAELLAFPGDYFAGFWIDDSRLAVMERNKTWYVYDSRPVNRAFIRFPVAPMPRAVAR